MKLIVSLFSLHNVVMDYGFTSQSKFADTPIN